MRVIGTAGHVDHGKSTLVQALTGIHPDRLKEEREREMTIDLGFAWMTLPNHEEVGIIDVPGHRDFIENMLAGVGGIDAVLFVVAADEGVMPQTREHLAILDLLQIPGGIVVLNKVDLIEDPEWLDLVEMDLHQVLSGTILENAPIIRVSALTRQGIDLLIINLEDYLAEQPTKVNLGKPRLSIDRIFSISGFGSVVTGTLIDGQIQLGDEIEVLPQGIRGRVRGLQTHKKKEEIAIVGSRTAVNISGIALEQLKRGNTLVHPGDYQTTRRIDTRFRLLPNVSSPLKHSTEVKFYLGAAEVLARARILGIDELLPGNEGWLQLELSEPIVAVRRDRYILRRPSPAETLGGGVVVDPLPTQRHKRFSTQVIEHLQVISQGTPAEILLQSLISLGAAPLKDVISKSHLEQSVSDLAVNELLRTGQLVNLESSLLADQFSIKLSDFVISQVVWESLSKLILGIVEKYHLNFPLMPGISREELRSRIKNGLRTLPSLVNRFFNLVILRLVNQGDLIENGPLVHKPGHMILFDNQQQLNIDILLRKFALNPYSPPSVKECQEVVGEDVYQALLYLGELVAVSPEVVFHQNDFSKMVMEIRRLLQMAPMTAAQIRDHFNTSRKYTLALMEYLDTMGVTVREGDLRRLK
jgi:selenocysteine-specific elongation factor